MTLLFCIGQADAQQLDCPIVDSGQATCYDDLDVIAPPTEGQAFFGQDAQHAGEDFHFTDNGDGTISDEVTGLMWQQMPDLYNKSSYDAALAGESSFTLAGYSDWRLPSVKELYSLIDHTGSSQTLTPYIDTNYFGFRWGDVNLGERTIDVQYWSSTEYVGRIFQGDEAVFGVNFGDGRIKGYPRYNGPTGLPVNFVRYVRGNESYGENQFYDNGDGTITDLATGLMWTQADSGVDLDWEDALAWAGNLNFAGRGDWRLPNSKELQSLVDYTRAPDAVSPGVIGPAIDPVFQMTTDESWFWTSTTLLEAPLTLSTGSHAVYICFGQGFGVGAGGNLINVHGAGAQRSDPKSGNPATWSGGFGPQNDEVRIFNYARAVRDSGMRMALDLAPASLQRGQTATLTANGAASGETVHFVYGLTSLGNGPLVAQLNGLQLDILAPTLLTQTAVADLNGQAILQTLAPNLPPSVPPLDVHLQAIVRRGIGGSESMKSHTVSTTL
ncbi:MAG: DUF1566 domain-containing protein [Planctomycetes bacterium]|nr:DUF1566 domain-containing protein [Planctomycetota bacterium]MCP4770371.1 DUF1566 domain-containing protein [Planctomycetota bacterium]MCP4860537.1 DUF1566 domain-containing protein [Planctomycetota bacterium]